MLVSLRCTSLLLLLLRLLFDCNGDAAICLIRNLQSECDKLCLCCCSCCIHVGLLLLLAAEHNSTT
jgi:hypothetical protein